MQAKGHERHGGRSRASAASGSDRATLLAAVALVVAAVSVYLGCLRLESRRRRTAARRSSLATVPVTRADVSTQNLVEGTLGYASDSRSLTAATAGVVEAVATPGAKLTRGALLARISGQPAVLLYGRRAAWRTLVAGMTGADVRQLNANLAALGYLPPGAASGDAFGAATEAAVRRLQAARGAVPTGIVPLGSVVFAPGAIRVGVVAVATGQTVEQGAQVLQMASARRVVSISLAAADQDSVHEGDPVSITLPNGQSTSGVVSDVARVATTPPPLGGSAGRAVRPAAAMRRWPSPCGCSTRAWPRASTRRPCRSRSRPQSTPNALAVPVGALLAQADGSVRGPGRARGRARHGAGDDGAVQRLDRPRGDHERRGARRRPGGRAGMSLVLELEDVSKTYPGTRPVEALGGVALAIEQGELLAITGPSGSGKSTLLHIMGTLDRPSDGRRPDHRGGHARAVRPRAVGPARAPHRLRVPAVLPARGADRARERRRGARLHGRPARQRERRARAVLERIGLGERLHHRPKALSGGEQQRVAIARALVNEPAIVLADEPTGNLDTATGAAILELIRELHAGGATIAIITHDRELARGLPRQVEMRDGQIVSDTRGDAVSAAPVAESRLLAGDLAHVGSIGLRTRRARTALSCLGIAIGIAAMVAVVGISGSSKANLVAQLDRLGTGLLTVQPGQSFSGGDAVLPLAAPGMVRRIDGVEEVTATGSVDASVFRTDRVPVVASGGLATRAVHPDLLRALSGKPAQRRLPECGDRALPRRRARRGHRCATRHRRRPAAPADLDRQPLVHGRRHPRAAAARARARLGGARRVPDRRAPARLRRVDRHALPARPPVARRAGARSSCRATVSPAHPEEVQVSRPSEVLAARTATNHAFTGLLLGLGAVALIVGGHRNRERDGDRRARAALGDRAAPRARCDPAAHRDPIHRRGVLPVGARRPGGRPARRARDGRLRASRSSWGLSVPLYGAAGGFAAAVVTGVDRRLLSRDPSCAALSDRSAPQRLMRSRKDGR